MVPSTRWLARAAAGGTALVAVLCAAPGPLVAQNDPAKAGVGTPTLTGAAAWGAIVGTAIAGTTRDGPYTEAFAPDGTVRHVDRDGESAGRWRLSEGRVCLAFPEDDEEECRAVEVAGGTGAFVDSDGSRYPFEIRPGKTGKP